MKIIPRLLFVLLSLFLGAMGGIVLGTVLTLMFFRVFTFLTRADLVEAGFVAVLWSVNAAVVFGILGGILGLVLGIKRVRKRK